MVRVALGIGSNLDRRRHIQGGVDALRERFGRVELSPVYRSASAGFDGPDFYNLTAVVETDMALDELKELLRVIEEGQGRTRGDEAFVSRTLDIDILVYGDTVIRANGHDIPRGEILQYAFVLKPLADVLPDARHPESGRSYAEHWHRYRENHGDGALSKVTWKP